MDDRILVVPPNWAPGPDDNDALAGATALRRRLERVLPVDVFAWPTLKGVPLRGEGNAGLLNAFRDGVRPEHHVVDISSGGETLLAVLSEQPARSVIAVGFFPSPAMLEAHGKHEAAAAMRLVYGLATGPAQMLPLLMQGADPGHIQAEINRMEAVLDRPVLQEITRNRAEIDMTASIKLSIPALYLSVPMPMAGLSETADTFLQLVPHARVEALDHEVRVHEEAGVHELADKVIPFIEEVIAARTDA